MSVRNSRGFTLIELLIVVVVIGVLAAIAIPKFGRTREKAIVASMKSDLKSLALAQESYSADHNGVYGAFADVQAAPYSHKLSPGNVGSGGLRSNVWYYQITNPGTTATCFMTMNAGADSDGVPTCNEGVAVISSGGGGR